MRGLIQNVCIVFLLVLCISCKSSENVVEQKIVETKPLEKRVVERNGFRELKVFTVMFEYSNGDELSFTVEVNPTKQRNALDEAFNMAENIATKDSTVISYSVRPGKYMIQFN